MTHCLVYRSEKKPETYLYLLVGKSMDDLPENLREVFGEPSLVMKLDITPDTRLAHADTATVSEALEENGYYLQLPPKVSVEEVLDKKYS